MKLLLLYPEIARRDCRICQKYLFNEDTGRVEIGRDGRPEERYFACPAPCRTDKGCPKGTPEKPRALNELNQLRYEHYLECRAVGKFPEDPLVIRNAVLIQSIEDEVKSSEERKFRKLLVELATGKL